MTKQPYPVVAERVLSPVQPKRFFSRARYGRSSEDVPVPLTGHRLVYRVRGAHVLDISALPMDSPTVVDATHVSVVNITTDTEVRVELAIPSQDASFFTARVTFLCTVEDPVAVLRTGVHDAEAALSGYLRGHQRLFELGLDFNLDGINDVRRKLNAQIRAYTTLDPPKFAGMTVDLASVEVTTPEELVKFQGALREEQQKHTVDTERLHNEQRRIDIEHVHKQTRETQEDQHTRDLDAVRRHHARTELSRTAEAVAADPVAALSLAYGAGEITAKEFAEELKRLRENEIAQDREDMRARIEYEREQARLRWEADRKEIEASTEFARERERAQWDAARLDKAQDAEWVRENWKAERAEAEREKLAKLEVIRELVAHGHADNLNVRKLDELINEALAMPPAVRSETGDDTPALTASAEHPVAAGSDDKADDEDGDDGNTKVEH